MKHQQRKILYKGLYYFVAFMLAVAFLYNIGAWNFPYLAQWRTFFYRWDIIQEDLFSIGGLALVVWDFLLQFFISPVAGVVVTAALMTGILAFSGLCLSKSYDTKPFLPWLVLPLAALCLNHYSLQYSGQGSIGILFCFIALYFLSRFKDVGRRLLYASAASIVLFFIAGPTAMLFALLGFIVQVMRDRKKGLIFILLPILVFCLSLISIWLGAMPDLMSALSPEGYYRQTGPHILHFLPYFLFLGIFFLAGLLKGWKKNTISYCIIALAIIAIAIFPLRWKKLYLNADEQQFKELSCYIHSGKWDKVIRRCKTLNMGNPLFQNCLNLALSQKGILARDLFHSYISGPTALLSSTSSRAPYINAILSEVYYAMGSVSGAQRTAFEANESFDNRSPVMLVRLTETNMANDYEKVAERYNELLNHTLFYRNKVFLHRSLQDVKAGIHPSANHLDNLEAELRDIVEVGRSNASIQYLGCYYLLCKKVEVFLDFLDSYCGTDALAFPLPESFQQAVVAMHGTNNEEILAKYHISDLVKRQYEAWVTDPTNNRLNLWTYLVMPHNE